MMLFLNTSTTVADHVHDRSINGKYEVQGAEEPQAFLQVFVSTYTP